MGELHEGAGRTPRSAADRLFVRVRAVPFLYRFTLFTRILLAAGFLPTGMVKLLGRRFTLISPDNPIGAFFEAMYQTGLYWQFLGLSQVVAAILLLVPRWAHLGAAAVVPIILNIFVVTVALRFPGTPVVVGLMLLASLYLVAWDYHRFRSLFTERPPLDRVPAHRLDRYEAIGFTTFATALLAFCSVTRDLVPRSFGLVMVLAGTAAGVVTLSRFVWLTRKGRLPPIRG